jgi:hypothetical protein
MVWHGCNETKFDLLDAAHARDRVSEEEIGENLTEEAICARRQATIQGSRRQYGSREQSFRRGNRAHGGAELEGLKKTQDLWGVKVAHHKTAIFSQQARESRRFLVSKTEQYGNSVVLC